MRHLRPYGFHLLSDVLPAEKVIADVKAWFKGFEGFYGRKFRFRLREISRAQV